MITFDLFSFRVIVADKTSVGLKFGSNKLGWAEDAMTKKSNMVLSLVKSKVRYERLSSKQFNKHLKMMAEKRRIISSIRQKKIEVVDKKV